MSEKQSEIQKEIVEKTLKFFENKKHGYINAAPRTGKCKIACDVLTSLYKDSDPFVLISYPNNTIKQSWLNEFDIWKYSNPNVIFVNFSSLKKYQEFKPDFFIIDEIHELSPQELEYCHVILTNSKDTLTLGLSGTISEETKQILGLPEIAKYTAKEGVEAGILSNYEVNVHLVELDTKIKTPNKKGKLLSEKQKYDNYGFVINKMMYEGRNFMALALARNRLSMSSIGKMNYLKNLLLQLKDKRVIIFTGLQEVAENIGIPYFHSKSDNTGFEDFQNEKINHLALVASGGVGVTYKNLDSVILLNFVGNPEAVTQQLFRAIKLDYKEKSAKLHILCLNEKPELKKIKESLSMLDKSKIKYV